MCLCFRLVVLVHSFRLSCRWTHRKTDSVRKQQPLPPGMSPASCAYVRPFPPPCLLSFFCSRVYLTHVYCEHFPSFWGARTMRVFQVYVVLVQRSSFAHYPSVQELRYTKYEVLDCFWHLDVFLAARLSDDTRDNT